MRLSTPAPVSLIPRAVGENLWLARAGSDARAELARAKVHEIQPEIIETEELVGRAMLEELEAAAQAKRGDLTIALLGGRGAQAMHRLLGERARAGDPDGLIGRLHLFTQDALAPMRVENGFSFVRDFERLLGREFFQRVKSFTQMRTDAGDLQSEVTRYVQKLEAMGGLDIFFLGLGPEAGGASHLAYIKPNSGASAVDVAGIIPISSTILEHHITKFKAGGSSFSREDETECRRATHILTLGPAAILGAKRIVQSIVDADTAPAKRVSYRRVLETEISDDVETRAPQFDENPGLWTRLHANVRSLILPNVLS
jgi:6-phosphogluconolactonase/glucosamine-6-phosphate isomerase/deaminase